MTFLAPWFLLGLAAVSIPLVLHLRRSRRSNRIVFSTTQFFDAQFMRSARRARIQDLLVMLLRMALLAALALALAQPLMRSGGLARLLALGGQSRTVALVIDDSASMTATGEAGVRLERAKAAALAAVDQLAADRGDRATVVLAGARDRPRQLFDQPTADLGAVRQAIGAIEPTDLAGDLDAAVAAAAAALYEAGGGTGRRIYVFSDFQQTAMAGAAALQAPPTVGLLAVNVGDAGKGEPGEPGEPGSTSAANLSVDAVQYDAARPMVGVPFTFRALLSNHAGPTRELTARLVVDGRTVGERRIEAAGGRSTIVRFTHRFAEAGWHGGHIAVDPPEAGSADLIEADNRRHFAVHVDDRMQLAAVNGAPSRIARDDELFFFRMALTVGPDLLSPVGTGPDAGVFGVVGAGDGAGAVAGAEADAAPPVAIDTFRPDAVATAPLDPFGLIVLANVPRLSEPALAALERRVDAGASLLISLGDRVDATDYNRWLGEHRLHGGLLPGRLGAVATAGPGAGPRGAADDQPGPPTDADGVDGGNPDAAMAIGTVDTTHPVLAGFDGGPMGSLAPVRLDRWFVVEPIDASVLMTTASGQPLLLEKRFGRGRVMLWATSIDRDWTNFPLQPTFVPLAYRMVGYLSQAGAGPSHFTRTGRVVLLPRSLTQDGGLAITTPDGSIAYGEPTITGAAVRFGHTERAGLYAVRASTASADARPAYLFAANIPAAESDPRAYNARQIIAAAGDQRPVAVVDRPEQLAAAGELAGQGYGLWDALLVMALLVGLFEPWVANRFSRRRAAAVAANPVSAAVAGTGVSAGSVGARSASETGHFAPAAKRGVVWS